MKIKFFFLILSVCLVISGCSDAQQKEQERLAEVCPAVARTGAAIWALKAHFMHRLRRYERGLVTGPGDKRVAHKLHIEYTSFREMKRHHLTIMESDLSELSPDGEISSLFKKVFDIIYQDENLDRWYNEKQVKADFKEMCMNGEI